MKKLLLSLLVIFVLGQVKAQELTKAEKKALKKEIKAYMKKLESYKDFKDNIDRQKERLTRLISEASANQEEVDKKQAELNAKNKEIKRLGEEKLGLKRDIEAIESSIGSQTNKLTGEVYKVQVVLSPSDIKVGKDEADGPSVEFFSGETDSNGNKRYTLGYFPSQEEAEEFKKALHALRIKSAIVAKYKDDQLVSEGE